MAPRRRALELVSRRCSAITVPRWSHVNEISASTACGDWAGLKRPERDGGLRCSCSTSSSNSSSSMSTTTKTTSTSTTSNDDLFCFRSSNALPRSIYPSSSQRGFAASAPSCRDHRTGDESDRDAAAEASSSSSSSSSQAPLPSTSPPPLPSPPSTSPLSSHWLSRVLPRRLWPFAELARLDKPAGTWLLAWPCCWSIVLGASSVATATAAAAATATAPIAIDVEETARLLLLFGAGAVLLRGAGCTVNDLWDREFDKKVARTSSRPLARGAVSVNAALAFLATQLAAGAAVLAQLSPGAVAVGAASLPLVAAYPLAKRVTHWPQAVLGLTFNWGALLGWAAVVGNGNNNDNRRESLVELVEKARSAADASLALDPVVDAFASPLVSSGLLSSPAPWLLYASGICWTLCYDTIYAYQDAKDDVKIGIKSSALSLRKRGSEKTGVAAFGAAAVALLAAAGEAAGIGNVPFFASVLLGPGAHMAWQCATLDPTDGENCAKRFKSNAVYGGLASAAIAVGVFSATAM